MSEDQIQTKICIVCQRQRPLELFYRNKQYSDGRDSRCKHCKRAGKTKQPHRHITKEKDNYTATFYLNGVKDEDFCKMWNLLSSLGYDTSSDIHRQFVDKHGLKYKKRPYRNTLRFQPQDCE